jgi:hypothetical protein
MASKCDVFSSRKGRQRDVEREGYEHLFIRILKSAFRSTNDQLRGTCIYVHHQV